MNKMKDFTGIKKGMIFYVHFKELECCRFVIVGDKATTFDLLTMEPCNCKEAIVLEGYEDIYDVRNVVPLNLEYIL